MDPDLLTPTSIASGAAQDLARRDARDTLGLRDQAHGHQVRDDLRDLQTRLWADDGPALLLVLQGMDTSGKDGTIRRVFSGVNPRACGSPGSGRRATMSSTMTTSGARTTSCPGAASSASSTGHTLRTSPWSACSVSCPRRRGAPGTATSATSEQPLIDEGTTIVEVFLHISRAEQRERLQARLNEPDKRWKFNRGDLDIRARWDDYTIAYEEAIAETSTGSAPWHVVPADRRWVPDAVVAQLLVSTLRTMDPKVPAADPDLNDVVVA